MQQHRILSLLSILVMIIIPVIGWFLVAQPQLLRLVAAQVVDHGVGPRHQPLEVGPALRRLDLQRHRLLAAREGLEELAVGLAQEIGAQAPADVAAQGRGLDLDHLGAQLAQQLGAIGAGGVLLDRHDAHAVQGSVHPLRLSFAR